jgi:hypothetical protein
LKERQKGKQLSADLKKKTDGKKNSPHVASAVFTTLT